MKLKDVTDEVFERECLKVCPDLEYQWYGLDDIIWAEGRDALKELTVEEFVEFAKWYDDARYDNGDVMCALQEAGFSIIDVYNKFNDLWSVDNYIFEECDDNDYPEDMDELLEKGIFVDVGWAYVCVVA